MLFILLLNITGYYPIFKWEQFRVRKEIKRRIKESVPGNELQVITFSKKNHTVNWVRNGQEFRYKGKMYDVVRITTKGDSIHYFCISDTKETSLFTQLDELVKMQMSHPSDSAQHTARNLLKIFLSLNYLPSQPIDISEEKVWEQNEFAYYFPYSEAFSDNTTPPPRLLG